MNQRLSQKDLGDPALTLAGFQLWIHGREFPEAEDYYDGNWLRVTAHCAAVGADVWAQGSILMTPDIEQFGAQCELLLQGEGTTAILAPLEPDLRIAIETVDHIGHLRVRVEITPDHLAQSHRMEFDIDQSYLPEIIRSCTVIVEEYSIRGQ